MKQLNYFARRSKIPVTSRMSLRYVLRFNMNEPAIFQQRCVFGGRAKVNLHLQVFDPVPPAWIISIEVNQNEDTPARNEHSADLFEYATLVRIVIERFNAQNLVEGAGCMRKRLCSALNKFNVLDPLRALTCQANHFA